MTEIMSDCKKKEILDVRISFADSGQGRHALHGVYPSFIISSLLSLVNSLFFSLISPTDSHVARWNFIEFVFFTYLESGSIFIGSSYVSIIVVNDDWVFSPGVKSSHGYGSHEMVFPSELIVIVPCRSVRSTWECRLLNLVSVSE